MNEPRETRDGCMIVVFVENVWLSDDGFYIREEDYRRVLGERASSHALPHEITEPVLRHPGFQPVDSGWENITEISWRQRTYRRRQVKGDYTISVEEIEDSRVPIAEVEERMVERQIAATLGTTIYKRAWRDK